MSASGNPAPSTTSFSPNPVPSLPGTTTLTVDNTSGVATGTYSIEIDGSATGADPKTTHASLTVFANAPDAPSLTAPSNGATNVALQPTFTWTGNATETESYIIDVATDAAFNNIVYTATVTDTTATPDTALPSNTQFFWRVTAQNECGEGTPSSTFSFTTIPVLHTVTPLNGAHGTTIPATPQSVIEGETTQFQVVPDAGYGIQSVTGCNGSLSGTTYTTGPIMADCTVITAFAPPVDVAVSIDDGQTFAQYGETLHYTITLNNSTSSAASGLSVSNTLPLQLDASSATWTCSTGSGACTSSGTGGVNDTGVIVPANGSIVYHLTVNVLADISDNQVDNQVTVSGPAGTHTADDVDTLVLFRSGFEQGENLIETIQQQPAAQKSAPAKH
jgi:uncharacterized repeat protein (TIGR01451 family)